MVAAGAVVIVIGGGETFLAAVEDGLAGGGAVGLAVGVVGGVLLNGAGAIGHHDYGALVVGVEIVRGAVGVKVAAGEIAVEQGAGAEHTVGHIVARS